MEETTTQQRTAGINITLYGNGINIKEITGLLEGSMAKNLVFRVVPVAIALNEDDKSTHLFIVMEDEDESVAKLKERLHQNGSIYICLKGRQDRLQQLRTAIGELHEALSLGLTPADFSQLHHNQATVSRIREQLRIFSEGIPNTELKRPATLGDGILPLPEAEARRYAALFDAHKDNLTLTKFVPASGAATRMFKSLCEFLADFDPESETINAYVNQSRKKGSALNVFLVGLNKFPFYEAVMQAVMQDAEYASWNKDMVHYHFIRQMLTAAEFDFANKPKGILPFHKYGGFVATPVYEHLKESVAYAGSQGNANVHFTISQEHLHEFTECIETVKPAIEAEAGITINYSFSYQQKHTDTLAVTLNNEPFRDEDGRLLFRPGGHGALIENLGGLDADIIFVKNIDNVGHDNTNAIALYKKALAGLLIELREQLFAWLDKMEKDELTETEIQEMITFAREKLLQYIPDDISKYTAQNRAEYIKQLFNRPIRVCGMVKNEGEPGGGPFWVEEEKGKYSLQIVESSQADLDNKAQHAIFASATHFNPVDLVCGIKDYKGNLFDLGAFTDPASGFIVYKNRMGRELKSYELPGLWNGAMAGWITLFAEVPLETFNPVKTVNDLLKPAHQPG